MERRNFIVKSGLLLASGLLPAPIYPFGTSPKFKMGLQLFTIRDAIEKDPIGSLKKAAALGYEDFELYGHNSEKVEYYGFKAKEFKIILDDLGLSASSGHYGFSDYLDKPADELKRFVDSCIEGAIILDKKYITWPWIAPKYRNLETFKSLPELLNRIGEQVTTAGLGFAYHNHDFEFVDYNGQTGYDIIVSETDPLLVKLQLDLYWAVHSSKLSPVELIAKQPERFVMWHIKDMDKVTRDYSELGSGSIDYVSMLPKIDTSGLEYFYLEQGGNFAQNSMQSITDSANYFKSHLKRYL